MRLDTMNRREFLALCALGSLSGALAACQSGPPSVGSATPTGKPTAQPTSTPTQRSAPSESDWNTLASNLQGTLIRPHNSHYEIARQLFNTRFDAIQPAAIAYCAAPVDVQICLAFTRRFDVSFAPRSGGHSYAGYSISTGLVIDVTRMNAISINANAGTAAIGAGARLIDVYAALSQHGVIIPGGSCATVGIAGLTLGGGISVLGRKFGLTCDNLLSAQVVVADGRILACDANHYADLFWALRGGGGGNFGVVTSFTFQTHPVSLLSIFTLEWPWSSAATVVDAWQRWAPQAPDELWSNCLLLSTTNKGADPLVRVNGVYVGDTGPLNSLLQQLSSDVGSAPTGSFVYPHSVLTTMLIEAGCYNMTTNECHLPTQTSQGQLQRDTSYAKSDYYTSLLPRQGIDALIHAIANRQASSMLGDGGIGMDAFGGAINRVAPDATAFAHRDALFSAQYSGNWLPGDSASIVSANFTWLNDLWQAMRPYTSGQAYQNYIDPHLPGWQQAYYGSNLPRLQQIKTVYDPNNLFHFAQSIPPAT